MEPDSGYSHVRMHKYFWSQRIAIKKDWYCGTAVCIGHHIYTFGRAFTEEHGSKVDRALFGPNLWLLDEVQVYDLIQDSWRQLAVTANNPIDIPKSSCRAFSCGKLAVLVNPFVSNEIRGRVHVLNTGRQPYTWTSFTIDLPVSQFQLHDSLCVFNNAIYCCYATNVRHPSDAGESRAWELSLVEQRFVPRAHEVLKVFNGTAPRTSAAVAWRDQILSFGAYCYYSANGKRQQRLEASVLLYKPETDEPDTQSSMDTAGSPPLLDRGSDVINHDGRIFAFCKNFLREFDPNLYRWKSIEFAGTHYYQPNVSGIYVSTPIGICYLAIDQPPKKSSTVRIYRIDIGVPTLTTLCVTAVRSILPGGNLREVPAHLWPLFD